MVDTLITPTASDEHYIHFSMRYYLLGAFTLKILRPKHTIFIIYTRIIFGHISNNLSEDQVRHDGDPRVQNYLNQVLIHKIAIVYVSYRHRSAATVYQGQI
jgi:hypothetical protein